MKNIWNDRRSLFNGNHFCSILSRTELARLLMETIFLVIGEREKRARHSRSVQSRIADIYVTGSEKRAHLA